MKEILHKTPGLSEGTSREVSDFYQLKPLRWPASCCDCRNSGTVDFTCISLKLRHCSIYCTHLRSCSETISGSCCVSSLVFVLWRALILLLNCCLTILFRWVFSLFLSSFSLIPMTPLQKAVIAFLCSSLRRSAAVTAAGDNSILSIFLRACHCWSKRGHSLWEWRAESTAALVAF